MIRDMDLVRKILFSIEDSKPFEKIINLSIDGYDMQEIAYHCEMLYNAGYIKDYDASTCDTVDGVFGFWVRDLTWDGQDFIETIRQDSIWNKTKTAIKNKGLPLVVDTIKTIANAFITAATKAVTDTIFNGGQI